MDINIEFRKGYATNRYFVMGNGNILERCPTRAKAESKADMFRKVWKDKGELLEMKAALQGA